MPLDLPPAERPGEARIEGCNWTPDVSSLGAASGSASGTVTSASEAWCRTTQTFDSDYVRISKFTNPAALDVMSLTQVSAVDNIVNTQVYNVATLYNKQEKVYLPVGTSGFTQYQKLALNAQSADQYNQSYGVVSGYIMGPQGTINTIQPYIKQEKWNDLAHSEHEFLQVGSLYGLQVTSSVVWERGDNIADPLSIYIDGRAFWRNLPGFASLGRWKRRQTYASVADYGMAGAYNTSGEFAWNNETAGKAHLVSHIQSMVNTFTASQWQNRACIPVPTVSDGSAFILEGDRVVQNTFYDTLRHDYS